MALGDFGAPAPISELPGVVKSASPEDIFFVFWAKAGAAYTFKRWLAGKTAETAKVLGLDIPQPPPASTRTGVTTAILNVRSRAGATNTRVGQLQPGVAVTIANEPFVHVIEPPPSTAVHDWARLIAPMAGFVAVDWLALNPLPPAPALEKNKLGIHVIGKNTKSDAILKAVTDCDLAGHPLASVTVVDDTRLAKMVKAISEKTFVVARYMTTPVETHPPQYLAPDGKWSAQKLYDQWAAEVAEGKDGVDAFQFANEWLPGTPQTPEEAAIYREFYKRFCDWYRQLADIAQREGIRVTIGDFSVGHPWLADPTVLKDTQDLLDDVCAAQDNIAMYHTGSPYTTPEGQVSFLADKENWADHYLKMARPGVRFIFGEARLGSVTKISPELFRSWMLQMQSLYGKRQEVIGANPFTWGGTDDNHWNDEDLTHVTDTLIDVVTHLAVSG